MRRPSKTLKNLRARLKHNLYMDRADVSNSTGGSTSREYQVSITQVPTRLGPCPSSADVLTSNTMRRKLLEESEGIIGMTLSKNNNNNKGGTGWQNELLNPSQRLAALHKSPKLSDLTITFPGHELNIKAHRVILAMSSPVFEAMLFGPLAEGPELLLHEDPPEAFDWLLQYIYKGHSHLPGVNQTVQIYQLASKYQLEPLITLCSLHLRSTLTPTTLPEMYDTAVLLEDKHLLERCHEVLSHSPKGVLSSSSFGQLSRSALSHLLQHPLHIPTEVVLLEALLAWGRCQSSSRSLREEIQEFLPKVRFLVMSTDEFVEHVMPAGVLTLEEMSDILMNIKELSNVSLPSLCCQIREKRLCYVESLLRTITLTTCHRHPRSKRSARGSIFVHSTHEQILIMNLRSNITLQLGRIECKAINPSSGSAMITIKDANGGVLDSATCEKGTPEVEFKKPVKILPGSYHSVTVSMDGHWPRGEMGEFSASEDEVQLEGKIAYTEGKLGSARLHFWSFN